MRVSVGPFLPNSDAVLTILALLGLLAIAMLSSPVSAPAPQRDPVAVQRELEEDYAAITPMPGSTRTAFSSTVKDRTVLVAATYRAAGDYAALRAYYDPELARNGWQLCRDEGLRAWGKDLGGMAAYYRKGDLRTSIQFAGERANYGWTYALGLSWGLSDECK